MAPARGRGSSQGRGRGRSQSCVDAAAPAAPAPGLVRDRRPAITTGCPAAAAAPAPAPAPARRPAAASVTTILCFRHLGGLCFRHLGGAPVPLHPPDHVVQLSLSGDTFKQCAVDGQASNAHARRLPECGNVWHLLDARVIRGVDRPLHQHAPNAPPPRAIVCHPRSQPLLHGAVGALNAAVGLAVPRPAERVVEGGQFAVPRLSPGGPVKFTAVVALKDRRCAQDREDAEECRCDGVLPLGDHRHQHDVLSAVVLVDQ
eukprot:scaffold21052_cov98-Isochrysis_galbana.AAC.2